jgi:hypothetical protein
MITPTVGVNPMLVSVDGPAGRGDTRAAAAKILAWLG